MKTIFTSIVRSALLIAGLTPAAFANPFTFATIVDPNLPINASNSTYAYGINSAGQIVGSFGNGSVNFGFVDHGGSFTTISDPSAPTNTFATGINDAGQLVGWDTFATPGIGVITSGFFDTGTTFLAVMDPAAAGVTEAYGINDSDQIVGFYGDATGTTHGFVDNGGIYTTIDDPLATQGTSAYGINNLGEIVGTFGDATGSHGFVDNGGIFTTIDDPLATEGTSVYGINDAGEIVGAYGFGVGQFAFLDNGGVFTTINDPLAKAGTPAAYGINDAGQIAGYFDGTSSFGTGMQGFVATTTSAATPEPSTLAMMFGSFLGVACYLARKRSLRSVFTSVAAIALLIAGLTPAAFADSFSFITINDPLASGAGTSAYGINNAGQIVGTGLSLNETFGFGDNNGSFTTINYPSAVGTTEVMGINGSDQIVGNYALTVVGMGGTGVVVSGFLDKSGSFTTIDDPSAAGYTAANGINGAGQIVGNFRGGNGNENHGFLDVDGSFTTIDDPLAPAGTTFASGINDAGEIVGTYGTAGLGEGFLDNNGVFTTIDDPLATNGTAAYGINDAGEIVGAYQAGNGTFGFLDNNGIFTTIDDPLGTAGTFAQGINDAGQIVGYFGAVNGAGNPVVEGFLATPASSTPEPSTLAMMLGSFLGMACYLARKRFLGSLPSGSWMILRQRVLRLYKVEGFNMKTIFTSIAGSALMILVLAPAAFAGSFTFTQIVYPSPGIDAFAYGINNAGQISGTLMATGATAGFGYTGGNFTTINDPAAGAGNTTVQGINDRDQLVGWYTLNVAGLGQVTSGFVDKGGSFTAIDDPSAPANTQAFGINDTGEIVGAYGDATGTHGFVDNGGPFTTIDDPSSAVNRTWAYGINDAGEIVGVYQDGVGLFHGFLDVGGTFTNIDDPLTGGAGDYAYGINSAGDIVGAYEDASGDVDAYLEIGGVYTTLDEPFSSLTTVATGINDAGQITGYFEGESAVGGLQSFLATPASATPEPSTLGMMCGSFLGMAWYLARKRLLRGSAAL